MRIFLTGFMGSGKSYTGKALARLCARAFVDLDAYIEARAGCTISEIFSKSGEAHFRQLEMQVLREFDVPTYYIMATGGGTPCFHNNMEWMNERGLTVFIDPPVEVLMSRLENESHHRPLLNTGPELQHIIEKKLEERRPCYEGAQIHLRPSDPKANVARLINDNLSITSFP